MNKKKTIETLTMMTLLNMKANKSWKKPTFSTITAEELKSHIQAAARSGSCAWYGR